MSKKDKSYNPNNNTMNNEEFPPNGYGDIYSQQNSGYNGNKRNNFNNAGYPSNPNYIEHNQGYVPTGPISAQTGMYLPPMGFGYSVPPNYMGFQQMPMKKYTEANLNAGMPPPGIIPTGPTGPIVPPTGPSSTLTSHAKSLAATNSTLTKPTVNANAAAFNVPSSAASTPNTTTKNAAVNANKSLAAASAPTSAAASTTAASTASSGTNSPISSVASGLSGMSISTNAVTSVPTSSTVAPTPSPTASTLTSVNAEATNTLNNTFYVITNSLVKYRGTLSSVDTVNMTITFKLVQMLGTEDRAPPGAPNAVLPSTDVYEFQIFRKEDLLKMYRAPATPETFRDPAIISSGAVVGTAAPITPAAVSSQSLSSDATMTRGKNEDGDFDFDASNKRFNKNEERSRTLALANAATETKYNKEKSFFDDLGSELGKSKRNDLDTFGFNGASRPTYRHNDSFKNTRDGMNNQTSVFSREKAPQGPGSWRNDRHKSQFSREKNFSNDGYNKPRNHNNNNNNNNRSDGEKKDYNFSNRKSQFDN